ncbi:hypothetical protein KI387_008122 [Taxus chinensis]|uniref:Uncharacterized protein n=1 Tax=Taxus chinensis TaxID=29808 RepID=A0AA38CS57_TAXCH|nr:hypothetical protein KI387_008122 [Taxus chinensis]
MNVKDTLNPQPYRDAEYSEEVIKNLHALGKPKAPKSAIENKAAEQLRYELLEEKVSSIVANTEEPCDWFLSAQLKAPDVQWFIEEQFHCVVMFVLSQLRQLKKIDIEVIEDYALQPVRKEEIITVHLEDADNCHSRDQH